MQREYSLIEIEQVAAELLESTNCKVFLFFGPMGVGKTTLIKTISKKLGVTETVSSPTFSLVNEYKTTDCKTVFHFDFYRIKNEIEALDMGVEEYFDADAYCLVEWPEKIKNLVPLDAISVFLSEMNNGKRKLKVVYN